MEKLLDPPSSKAANPSIGSNAANDSNIHGSEATLPIVDSKFEDTAPFPVSPVADSEALGAPARTVHGFTVRSMEQPRLSKINTPDSGLSQSSLLPAPRSYML